MWKFLTSSLRITICSKNFEAMFQKKEGVAHTFCNFNILLDRVVILVFWK